jgi:hypothetical protein
LNEKLIKKRPSNEQSVLNDSLFDLQIRVHTPDEIIAKYINIPPIIRRTVKVIFIIPHKINFFENIKYTENRNPANNKHMIVCIVYSPAMPFKKQITAKIGKINCERLEIVFVI